MEMIGIDLWTKTYVVLKDERVICTENTLEYLEQEMKRKDEDEILITVASCLNGIAFSVKKAYIEDYFKKGEKSLSCDD